MHKTVSVLCVDDDRNLCDLIAKALREEGYEVRTAYNGDEAIDEIQQELPDLLLLDVMLPRRDGFEVLEAIRQLPGPAAQLPVVLITGCTPTPSYTQRATALRALDLLSKPVTLDKLVSVVVAQLGEAKPAEPPEPRRRRRGISGKLERIPFPAVLHHLHGLRATGVLALASEKKRKWIQLRDGYPVAVRSNLLSETLGHMLVRSGRITKTVLETSRRQIEFGDSRQGEILVAMEALSLDEVAAALREQADEKFFEVFTWLQGEFRFARGSKLQRASAFAVGRSPANLILCGVRSRLPIGRIDRYFELHGDRCLTHGESPFYRSQNAGVEPFEEALLRALDGTQRLAEFALEDEGLRRTIYALIASGLLELRRIGDREKVATRRRATATPTPKSRVAVSGEHVVAAGGTPLVASGGTPVVATTDPRLEELNEFAQKLRSGNHFAVLGVDPNAEASVVREAYERLSARTHPDRFSNGSRTVKDLAAEVFAMVTDGYETLSDPTRLQEYLLIQMRAQREQKEKRQGELAFEAETEFRRGEDALRARDYESALRHFGKALELYPEEGNHHAHYGWALYLCHPDDPSMLGEALEHVRRGLKLASHREKPYLFMGRLCKAIGRADVAQRMFARVLEIQPECDEALREMRLIDMRRQKSKGLVGRLLRRARLSE